MIKRLYRAQGASGRVRGDIPQSPELLRGTGANGLLGEEGQVARKQFDTKKDMKRGDFNEK